MPSRAAAATRRCSRWCSPWAGFWRPRPPGSGAPRRAAGWPRREIFTALSCWKRLSERGRDRSRIVAMVDERHELAVRAGDVDVLELLGVEPLDARDLRDDLVAAAGHAEAVDEVAAHRAPRGPGRPVCRLSPSWATFSRSITISDSGWSIFTSMSGGKANMPLLAAFSCSCSAKPRISAVSAVEAMTNSTGKLPPPGSAGGRMGKVWMPGMAATFCCTSGRIWKAVRLRSFHGFSPIAPEAAGREGDLEGELASPGWPCSALFTSPGRLGHLVERGVGGRVHDAEDDALVLGRGELARATGEHGDGEQRRSPPRRCR